ncbi:MULTISPECIES: energy transducer TonB [Pseudoalteromonas]|uniref:TonB family C-terminal domain protein n=1 Tax=Pseudoalteromonas luteoviolacea (strain 2ta16) TaxID=1353533 RepID=V4HIE6_PSEL2|nr:energy transducer TonB [Pseudoalteromonas luteoviolacea]ESP90560.1 TonB family C-terminal domain protein [Pseudoalteromonas luteoviolacea 2ta16]KZN41869.1 hypothetical protein N483_14450 [Pseudoalteromonas luteoviolacea NCIMB 1944]MCG7550466.1 energy transducer TonB [Pseudoalteromonas sp. Of7M-16]
MKVSLILSLILILCSCASSSDKQQQAIGDGYVILSFDINEQGQTENIEVVESSHEGFFDNEAINSLKKWKYRPKLVNGVPTKKENQKVQLEFKIKKD